MSAPASPQITAAPETYYFPLTIDELAQLLQYGDYGRRALDILKDDPAKINLLRHFDSVMGVVAQHRHLLKEEQQKATTLLTELWSSGVEADLATLIDEFRQPIPPTPFDPELFAPLDDDLPYLNASNIPMFPPARSVNDWGYTPCDNCQQKSWTCQHGDLEKLAPCDECNPWKTFCSHSGPHVGWTYRPCAECGIFVDHCEHGPPRVEFCDQCDPWAFTCDHGPWLNPESSA